MLVTTWSNKCQLPIVPMECFWNNQPEASASCILHLNFLQVQHILPPISCLSGCPTLYLHKACSSEVLCQLLSETPTCCPPSPTMLIFILWLPHTGNFKGALPTPFVPSTFHNSTHQPALQMLSSSKTLDVSNSLVLPVAVCTHTRTHTE